MKHYYQTFAIGIVFCLVHLLSAQQLPANISPQALQQALNQTGGSPSPQNLDFLKKKYGRSLEPDAAKIGAQDSSKKQEDTLETTPVVALPISTYESLFKNIPLIPDSLLKSLPIFGLDMFEGAKPTSFAPGDYGATPADYPVGPGDEIAISLWGRMNEEYRLKVDRDGRINIPHIGPVAVAGLPFGDMQKSILNKVQNIEGVQASISMGELRSIGVYVVGEVKTPGLYTINSLSNVTNALFLAGGPTHRGSLRNIQVKRNGALVSTVDFYDFLLSGRDNTGLRLQSGDAIVVPIAKAMVAIAGNVRRSALYELKNETKLKEALAIAGGLAPTAWASKIQIERFIDNQYQVVLDVASTDRKTIPDFDIKDGDIVKVFPVVVRDKNAVYLSGNVARPGKYEFKDGMTIRDLLPDYSNLLPETYFNFAVVIRQDPPSFLDRLIPFNLKAVMENNSAADNLALQPKDVVHIYLHDFFEPDRNVSIGGAVTDAGTYKLLENMKIRDLLVKAGGILEKASTDRGELYRRISDNDLVSTEKIDFCVHCALEDDPQHNLVLKKSDRVYIRTKTGWEDEKRITLKGEIKYPGEYILLKNETLDQLINRAGGFTDEAYLPAAIFSRPSVKNLEKERIDQYILQLETDAIRTTTELAAKNQQIGDAQQLLAQQELLMSKLRVTETVGRVVIDLTNSNNYKGLTLEDGDMLVVPKISGTVSVIGEVFNASTFKYNSETSTVRNYLNMTGGMKSTADKKNVYIFKANGSILTKESVSVMNYKLSPGDVVVVPQQMQFKNNFKTFLDSVDAIFKIATVLTAIATLIIAVNTIN